MGEIEGERERCQVGLDIHVWERERERERERDQVGIDIHVLS